MILISYPLFFFIMIESKFKNILVDFNTLIDTDEGCIRYLLKTYPNSPFFLDYMKDTNDYYIRYALLTRTEYNPLSILFKEEYKSSIDDLYNELKETKWEEVLSLSYPTDIFKFLNMVSNQAGYIITVNCDNIHEQVKLESFKDMDQSWNISIGTKNIRKYFSLVVKNIYSFSHMRNISGKTIYFYDYGPNFTDYHKKVINPILVILSKTNILKFIFPYSNFEFPIDEIITEEKKENETSNKHS